MRSSVRSQSTGLRFNGKPEYEGHFSQIVQENKGKSLEYMFPYFFGSIEEQVKHVLL